MNLRHMGSCESWVEAQKWITQHFIPPCICQDAVRTGDDRASDAASQQAQPIPSAPFLVAGPERDHFSNLNLYTKIREGGALHGQI